MRNYSNWDPMITTFPGLYITAAGVAEIFSFFLRISPVDLCSNFLFLRLLNIIFLGGSSVLLYYLLRAFLDKQDSILVLWRTIALTLFPLHLFFHFVYYTDSGSTFFVLLCYLLATRRKYSLSGLAGVIAVIFRQTNVAWVALVAFSSLLRDFETVEPSSKGTLALQV